MQSSRSGKEIHLVARPRGEPQQSDFAVVEATVSDPGPGEVLVHNRFISVDPYMRGRMRDAIMRGENTGKMLVCVGSA